MKQIYEATLTLTLSLTLVRACPAHKLLRRCNSKFFTNAVNCPITARPWGTPGYLFRSACIQYCLAHKTWLKHVNNNLYSVNRVLPLSQLSACWGRASDEAAGSPADHPQQCCFQTTPWHWVEYAGEARCGNSGTQSCFHVPPHAWSLKVSVVSSPCSSPGLSPWRSCYYYTIPPDWTQVGSGLKLLVRTCFSRLSTKPHH